MNKVELGRKEKYKKIELGGKKEKKKNKKKKKKKKEVELE